MAAGIAVTAAEPSGLWGMLKEGMASSRALLQAKSGAGSTQLMTAVVESFETSEGRNAARDGLQVALKGAKPDEIKPKAKLQQGGHVSDLVKAGTAEIGIHQISEIVGQPGISLVGPLPAEIQNYTVYVVGLSTAAKEAEAAKAFIKVLTGPSAAGVLKSKGMEGA